MSTGTSNVVVHMSQSLDGFVCGPDDGPERGLGVGGEALHAWLAEGGTTDPTTFRPTSGVNAQVFDEMLATGAVITGRHTFEWAGEWGDDHHDGVPIYVLTRTQRPDRGTVRYRSDLAAAVAEAKVAAGDREIMVHGATSVQALLRLGLVDELALTLVPVVLGSGKRLFDDVPAEALGLTLTRSLEGEGGVLHLRYAVTGLTD